MTAVVATVAGSAVEVAEVDAMEAALRGSDVAATLPSPGTSEGRQLRRWLTQLAIAERVVAAAAAELDVREHAVPTEDDVLPDAVARLDIGSIPAAVLRRPLARAVFAHVTAHVTVPAADVEAYRARNPLRFREPVTTAGPGWTRRPAAPADVARELLGAARRRAFATWLDQRRAELTVLAPGYEHPGDPRQPDNTHKH